MASEQIGGLALMVPLDGGLCNAQLFLDNIGFDAEVGQLIAQSLILYPQIFALLLSDLDLFVQHDGSLQGDVVRVL
jgi:hypothetical protein